MGRWPRDATVFDVAVTPNIGRNSSSSRIPKPVLAKLGNPARIRFIIEGDTITVTRPD